MLAAYGFAGVMGTRPDDRMYDCLPMYHTNGGVVATGATLVAGGSVFIREKFSVREFWDDVVGHDCTMFIYIGELCRYLVEAPRACARTRAPAAARAAATDCGPTCGRGSRRGSRFPHILEFYAATEGNVALFNFDGTPGAVGRAALVLAKRFPIASSAFDVEPDCRSATPTACCELRRRRGRAKSIGEILNDPAQVRQRFEGYANPRRRERRSCATCSRRATPGSAPATS